MPQGREGWRKTIYEQLAMECNAMLRFALSYGLVVNPTIVEVVTAALHESGDPPSIVSLTKAHRLLSAIVAPAEPHAILLVHGVRWFNVRLLRALVIAAVLSIVAMVALGMSPEITADPDAGNPLLSGGWVLLSNQLFFISIASLGACFHGLFTVNRYIVDGTYDPNYETTYLVRYLLGVMSGLILASLIDLDPTAALYEMARPLLALVGGFSASVVYRVLQRLVETVERLLGVESDKLGARLRSREIEDQVDIRMDEASPTRVEQAQTVAALVKLKAQLQGEQTSAAVREQLDALIEQLVGREAPTPEASEETSTPPASQTSSPSPATPK